MQENHFQTGGVRRTVDTSAAAGLLLPHLTDATEGVGFPGGAAGETDADHPSVPCAPPTDRTLKESPHD